MYYSGHEIEIIYKKIISVVCAAKQAH